MADKPNSHDKTFLSLPNVSPLPNSPQPHSHLSKQLPPFLLSPLPQQMVTELLPCLAEELDDEGLVALHRQVNILHLTHTARI